MTIHVVCPGCHKRFQVSDKFAGKKGPCPNCKAEISIPAEGEEVVVHEPQSFGPKGKAGRAVLKPIFREETRLSAIMAVVIGGSIFIVLLAAVLMRMTFGDAVPTFFLALGALLLAPPLSLGGYAFLRDAELEPHRGIKLYVRVAICAVLYAGLWGALWLLNLYVFRGAPFTLPQMALIVPVMLLAGGGAAFAALDLEYLSGVLHFSLYLVVSVALRLLMGLSAFPST
jgi:hypothetical protein